MSDELKAHPLITHHSSLITHYSSHISSMYVECAARVFGGEGEVRQYPEGREADGDAVAHLERRRARFGLRARDEDGDAEALLRRVDRHIVERRLALGGAARDEGEPGYQALIRAGEVLLLDHPGGQTSAPLGPLARPTQGHVFGPGDELDRPPLAGA